MKERSSLEELFGEVAPGAMEAAKAILVSRDKMKPDVDRVYLLARELDRFCRGSHDLMVLVARTCIAEPSIEGKTFVGLVSETVAMLQHRAGLSNDRPAPGAVAFHRALRALDRYNQSAGMTRDPLIDEATRRFGYQDLCNSKMGDPFVEKEWIAIYDRVCAEQMGEIERRTQALVPALAAELRIHLPAPERARLAQEPRPPAKLPAPRPKTDWPARGPATLRTKPY